VEPGCFLDSEVCFNLSWTPFPNEGCGGYFPPTTIARGGLGKTFLVNYCNFIVNTNHSL
jgi:hypothetical protein